MNQKDCSSKRLQEIGAAEMSDCVCVRGASVTLKSFGNLRLHASRGDLVADPDCGQGCDGDISCAVSSPPHSPLFLPTFMPRRPLLQQLKYDGFDAERDYD